MHIHLSLRDVGICPCIQESSSNLRNCTCKRRFQCRNNNNNKDTFGTKKYFQTSDVQKYAVNQKNMQFYVINPRNVQIIFKKSTILCNNYAIIRERRKVHLYALKLSSVMYSKCKIIPFYAIKLKNMQSFSPRYYVLHLIC